MRPLALLMVIIRPLALLMASLMRIIRPLALLLMGIIRPPSPSRCLIPRFVFWSGRVGDRILPFSTMAEFDAAALRQQTADVARRPWPITQLNSSGPENHSPRGWLC